MLKAQTNLDDGEITNTSRFRAAIFRRGDVFHVNGVQLMEGKQSLTRLVAHEPQFSQQVGGPLGQEGVYEPTAIRVGDDGISEVVVPYTRVEP